MTKRLKALFVDLVVGGVGGLALACAAAVVWRVFDLVLEVLR